MKSIKKILSSILVLSMLLVMVTLPVQAAVSNEADTVRILGVLKGDGAGVTEEYLAKSTNRSQGARILLRLMGLETESDAFAGTATFTDAGDASSYWQKMLSYLKANPGVGFQGYPDGSFKPNKIMTAQEIYKVLLTSLGYVENVDFTWNGVFAFAAEKGLTSLYGKQNITNNDLATALVEALNANKKDGIKLINFLVQEGVVTSSKAAEAGFITITSVDYQTTYQSELNGTPNWPSTLVAHFAGGTTGTVAVTWSSVNTSSTGNKTATGTVAGYGVITVTVEVMPDVLTVMDAFPSDADEITVVLNKPAPEGTSVSLKRGAVGIISTIVWAENRKSFTFTQGWNFTPGDYTVMVAASSKTFSIALETIESISIGADYMYPLANQDLKINLINQYGQAVNISNVQITISNITKGTQVPFTISGKTVIADGSNASLVEATNQLMVFVLHNTSMKTATKQIPVYSKPVIKALQFGAVTIANSKTTIGENTAGHKVQLYAVDQYGNPIKLTNTDIQAGGKVTLISSNPAVINPSSVTINADGDLVFNAEAAGTCNLTLLVPTEGIVTSQLFTVYAVSSVSRLDISGPTGRVTAGATVDLVATATDQYGTAIPLLNNYTHSKLITTSTNPTFVPNGGVIYDASRGVLRVMAGVPGTAMITYSYDGNYMGTFSVTVVEAAKPVQIVAVNLPTAFQTTATRTLTAADLTIKDQYGDDFDLAGTGYSVQVELLGTSSTYLGVVGNSITDSTSSVFTATSTQGTATVKLTVMDPSTGAITNSEYQTTVEVVGAEDIATYTFESVPVMYGAAGTAGTAYERTLVINGKTSSNKTVQLAGGPKPAGIDLVTSDGANFTFNETTMKLSAQAAGTTYIKAWVSGSPVASVTVTATATAPVVTTLYFDSASITKANSTTFNAKDYMVAKDQYGVDVKATASFFFASSNTTYATVNASTGAVTTTATDGTTKISVIALDSGTKSAFFDLIVQ